MSSFRDVTPGFAVAPQIAVTDLDVARREGFALIVNNRPDGEASDQPSSAEMEAAARAAGLDYAWFPVTGGPTPAQADAMTAAVARASGPTLAFCRSGTRSINTWAFGQARARGHSIIELTRLGANAGYDLSWLASLER